MKNKLLLCLITVTMLAGCTTVPKYTVTWKNDDGTILELDENVEEGSMPSFDSAEPTKAGNAQYSYEFAGWDKEVTNVTGDITYTATFEQIVNKYTITWKNDDGSTLGSGTYEYGATPEYGSVPFKEDDETYSYEFKGWSPAITTVTSDATYTATFEKKELVPNLGLKTIAEVRELCNELKDLNEAGIAVDMTRKVTIRGLALAKTNTTLTTSKYGYDLSAPNKTIFGDATGYIGCASGTGDNTLWGKVADHAGKSTSSYEITGYLSMYQGQPELYVPSKTYEWKQELNIEFDPILHSKGNKSGADFYDIAADMMYNVKGHAYGDVYTIKNMRVFEKRDDTYYATDGDKFIKIIGNKPTLSVGYTYDLTGFISMLSWRPNLFLYSANNAVKTEENIDKNNAISITSDELVAKKTSQEYSTYKYPDYIKSWGNLYKTTVYATYIVENGKLYIAVRSTYYTGKNVISGKDNAMQAYKMLLVVNDNYWNLDENQMWNYCPIASMLNEEISFDMYYMAFDQGWANKKPTWRIFAINSLLELPIVEA